MNRVWFNDYMLKHLHQLNQGNMGGYIGIELIELGPDYLKGTMPVYSRACQPMGILHGGASLVLAETLGSIAANLAVDPLQFVCVGLDINANHIRAAKEGIVTGTARPVHIGGSTQVWGIEITDVHNRIVCISRLTMAVLKLEKGKEGKNPFAMAGER